MGKEKLDTAFDSSTRVTWKRRFTDTIRRKKGSYTDKTTDVLYRHLLKGLGEAFGRERTPVRL